MYEDELKPSWILILIPCNQPPILCKTEHWVTIMYWNFLPALSCNEEINYIFSTTTFSAKNRSKINCFQVTSKNAPFGIKHLNLSKVKCIDLIIKKVPHLHQSCHVAKSEAMKMLHILEKKLRLKWNGFVSNLSSLMVQKFKLLLHSEA